MNKFLLLLLACMNLAALSFSQNDKDKKTISGDEARESLDKIGLDSTFFLQIFATSACGCVDSVDKAETAKKKKLSGIPYCIDRDASAYQLASKLLVARKSTDKNTTISIGDKNSTEYRQYYYDIERWLKDSCKVLNKVISSNDEASTDKSFSKDPAAMEAYNKGVGELQKENYADAIPHFEKAVNIDPEFAFAWDNLGVCYRRTGKFEKAELAYRASLNIDPAGKTALQNLPVVYQLMKKIDEAIAAYNDFLLFYPDDPEVYYGLSLLYISGKQDMEKALANVCRAYNIYTEQQSPYRADAEKVINMIYTQLKKQGKEEVFDKILSQNKITSYKK